MCSNGLGGPSRTVGVTLHLTNPSDGSRFSISGATWEAKGYVGWPSTESTQSLVIARSGLWGDNTGKILKTVDVIWRILAIFDRCKVRLKIDIFGVKS